MSSAPSPSKRRFLLSSAGLTLAGMAPLSQTTPSAAAGANGPYAVPGGVNWPSEAQWRALGQSLQGRLYPVPDPLASCRAKPDACAPVLDQFQNPFFIQDTPGATQTSGWHDAWENRLSAYVAEVANTDDVARAVRFARQHHLRLVVKGGAHSYLGQSNAPDSLLIWTKRLDAITMHERFVPRGAPEGEAIEAISVGGGAIWLDVYDAASVKGNRYVQGGGCTTVGVGGHLQTGGFGSFSKRFGTSAGGIVEAEVVLADGSVVIANAYQHHDLFWALKGAGAAFGIITRATLRLHPLPETFGFAGFTVQAQSAVAYTELVRRFLRFYRESLMNPHWGEQVSFTGNNELDVAMSIQGLSEAEARAVWQPFLDWLGQHAASYTLKQDLRLVVLAARHWWDYDYRSKHLPHSIVVDPRPDGKTNGYWWSGNSGEVHIYLAGYESGWLHRRWLDDTALPHLAETLVAASREHDFGIHFNKGLAGAPPEVAGQVADLAINPIVADAFGLVIVAGGQSEVFPGLPGHEPDQAAAAATQQHIRRAMARIRELATDAGGYSSEMSYFAPHWQQDAWGDTYPRLLALKRQYDPSGLFTAHHYVGSES